MAALEDRDAIAAPQGEVIKRLSKKHAAEFRSLLGNPPDPANVPAAFWEKVQKEDEDALMLLMLLLFIASYDAHRTWGDMNAPGSSITRDQTADRWSSQKAKQVAAGISEHSQDMLGTAGRQWAVKRQAGEPIPRDEVDSVIDSIFGDTRTDTIIRTEAQDAMVQGGDQGVQDGAKDAGVGFTRYWGHSGIRPSGHCNATDDPCPICSPMEGLPESQWGDKFPGRCHSNDDCFVTYLDSEGYVIGTSVPGMIPGNIPGHTWKFRKP